MGNRPHFLSVTQCRRILRSWAGRRVAVLGDTMLDCFLCGEATRISPEAPVPVVVLQSQTWTLGGAGNVAANIAGLGGRPLLLTALGADAGGARVRRLAAAGGIELGRTPLLTDRPTTVKYRVFAGNKHMLRFDRESVTPISASCARSLVAELEAQHDLDAVVISDYAKGCVSPTLVRQVARLCAARRWPWCVDPKLTHCVYRGVTVLKPNQKELEALANQPVATPAQLRRAALRVLRRHQCRHLMVTRGRHGIALFSADGTEHWLDAHGQSVADVTGAGDTVSAVVGLGLASGLALPHIVALANRAGAYVVTQPGTAVVHAADLLRGIV